MTKRRRWKYSKAGVGQFSRCSKVREDKKRLSILKNETPEVTPFFIEFSDFGRSCQVKYPYQISPKPGNPLVPVTDTTKAPEGVFVPTH